MAKIVENRVKMKEFQNIAKNRTKTTVKDLGDIVEGDFGLPPSWKTLESGDETS